MSEHILQFHGKPSYLRIGKDNVVTLRSAVFDANTDELIEFRHDLMYLHGGYGGAPAKVEAALEGLEVEMKVEVSVSPEEGFGAIDPDRQVTLPISELPEPLRRIGTRVAAETPEGGQLNFRVTAIEDNLVRLDANHPLAGRSLRFVLEVRAIRTATNVEIARGYVTREDTGNVP